MIIRQHPLISGGSIAYLIAFTLYGVLSENSETIVYLIAMTLAFTFVARAYVSVHLSTGVLLGPAAWGFLHLAGGLIDVSGRVLYSVQLIPVVLRYDQAVHALGFGFGTLALWQGLRRFLAPDLSWSAGLGFTIALAGMGLGALNEVLEFFATRLSDATNVGGYVNTGWDLVFNMIGSMIATLLVAREARRRGAGNRTYVL